MVPIRVKGMADAGSGDVMGVEPISSGSPVAIPGDPEEREKPAAVAQPDPSDGQRTEGGPTGKPRSRGRRQVIEWLVIIAVTLAVTLILRTFFVQAFVIPTASMEPTLKIGDRVLVEKVGFHLQRGDLIVFNKPPADKERDTPRLIKRVIGLPGDTVSAQGGYYYIDGKRLDETWLPAADRGVTCAPNSGPPSCLPFAPVVVGQGEYFVSGDNRTDSFDSRYFGPISGKLIIGKVFLKIWPLSAISTF